MSFDETVKLIETAALVIGGLWTVWTFYELQSARAADLENQTKLTALLRQQPVLAIEIRVTETGWDADRSNGLLVVHVMLKNEGDQNLEVYFDETTLSVGRIALEKSGKQTIKEQQHYPHAHLVPESSKLEPIEMRIFRAGQKRQLAFSVPISKVAGYLIQFHAVYQRRRFEGEKAWKKAPRVKPFKIIAVEQAIFFAKGTENGNSVT